MINLYITIILELIGVVYNNNRCYTLTYSQSRTGPGNASFPLYYLLALVFSPWTCDTIYRFLA